MTDTALTASTPLRRERDRIGLSRERVAAQLEPPISSKTLERWERPGYKVPLWRLQQLARLYEIDVDDVLGSAAA